MLTGIMDNCSVCGVERPWELLTLNGNMCWECYCKSQQEEDMGGFPPGTVIIDVEWKPVRESFFDRLKRLLHRSESSLAVAG